MFSRVWTVMVVAASGLLATPGTTPPQGQCPANEHTGLPQRGFAMPGGTGDVSDNSASVAPFPTDWVPGEILVNFRAEALAWEDGPGEHPDVKPIFQAFAAGDVRRVLAAPRGRLAGLFRVRLANPSDTGAALQALRTCKQVHYAEPNRAYFTTDTFPNDPDLTLQWHLHNAGQTGGATDADIDGPAAWDVETGDPGAVIAIIDTGTDYDHPDLAANVWHNPGESGNGRETNLIDDDLNGFIDDYIGWDFVSVPAQFVAPGEDPGPPDNDPMDFKGHGTWTAGLAAAVGNNEVGGTGVAWGCTIMVVRAGYENTVGKGALQVTDIVAAIDYAVANGADIINMSFGGGASNVLTDALLDAYEAGVTLIAAAGNGGHDEPLYPAALPFVLAVAATDHDDAPATFTSYGAWVDVAAPGVGIYSTYFDNTYHTGDGTSASCPIVAGIAGLCLSHTPTLTNEEIYQVLRSTADPVSPPIYVGVGRVNAYAAVNKTSVAIAKLDPDLDGLLTFGGSLEVRGTASGAYTLYYGPGVYPTTWTAIATGGAVTDGLLATWGMEGVTETGNHCLRLIVDEGLPQQAEDRTVLWIDPTSMVGWPQAIPSTHTPPYIEASPVVADLDRDGLSEVFAISYRGHAFLWNADGSVVPGWPKTMGTAAQQGVVGSPAVANIDGGTDLELVVATGPFPDALVNVWKRDGSDAPGWPQVAGPFRYHAAGGAVAGDIDGDRNPEIICGSYDLLRQDPAMVYAWHHDGTPVAGWPLVFPGVEMMCTSPVSLADFDRDGDLDVVIKLWSAATPNQTTVSIVDESGTPFPGWPQVRTGGGASAVSIGDIDADGHLELFFGTSAGSLINALDHEGNNLPNWPPPEALCTLTSTVALGDVDGDGDLEVAFQDKCSNVFLYHHDGTLMPGWPQDIGNLFVIGPALYSSVSIGDVNGDGAPDLVVGAAGTARLLAFDLAGNVLPGFPKLLNDDGFPQVLATPAITDLNRDGTVEITVGGRDGAVYVWDLASAMDECTNEWPRFRNQLVRHGRHDRRVPGECEGPIHLDVRPGICPNPFNRSSHGVLPVALLGTGRFDVTTIDISSVRLARVDAIGGSLAPYEGPPGPYSALEDVATPFAGDPCDCHDATTDGFVDLMVHFKTDDLVEALDLTNVLPGGWVELVVSGSLLDGRSFTSMTDCVRLVPASTPPPNVFVTSNLPGAWADADPLDATADGGGFADFARSHMWGATVTLMAEQTLGGRPFVGWEINGVMHFGDPTVDILLNGTTTLRAVYRFGGISTTSEPSPAPQAPVEEADPAEPAEPQ